MYRYKYKRSTTKMSFALDEDLKKRLGHKVDFDLIEKRDRQMRFRNSKDPIYGAFNVVDNQSVSRLFVEFIKDITFDIKDAIKKMSEEQI